MNEFKAISVSPMRVKLPDKYRWGGTFGKRFFLPTLWLECCALWCLKLPTVYFHIQLIFNQISYPFVQTFLRISFCMFTTRCDSLECCGLSFIRSHKFSTSDFVLALSVGRWKWLMIMYNRNMIKIVGKVYF